MLITITLTLSILVAINFALLLFSCNKHPKKVVDKPIKTKSTKIVQADLADKNLQKTATLVQTIS